MGFNVFIKELKIEIIGKTFRKLILYGPQFKIQ